MRAQPNIASVSATFVTLPKDTYQMQIGEPKAVVRGKDDKAMHGLMIPMTVMEGPQKGKKVFPFFNVDENFIQYLKQVAIAGYGYELTDEGENEFNQNEGGNKDATVDTDSKFVGDLWADLKGKVVEVDATVNVGKEGTASAGKEFNQFNNWRPI